MAHPNPATLVSLVVATVWLVVAVHELAFSFASHPSGGRHVTVRLERPLPLRPPVSGNGAVVRLSVLFVVLGLVLVPTSVVTWRAYVVGALAVAALAVACVPAERPVPEPSVRNQRLVVASVSLAGVLGFWIQAGAPNADYFAEGLPVLGGLVLAALVYWLIVGVPAIRRGAQLRRELAGRVSELQSELDWELKTAERLARRTHALQEERDRLAGEKDIREDELRELRESRDEALVALLAARQGDTRGRQLAAAAPPMLTFEYCAPTDDGNADQAWRRGATGSISIRVIRIRMDAEPRALQQQAARSSETEEENAAAAPSADRDTRIERSVAVITARTPGELTTAVADYLAGTTIDGMFPVLTDTWVARDPGGFGAGALALDRAEDGIHQFLLGVPAASVGKALGAPVAVAAVADGVTGKLPLPVDGPMEFITTLVEIAGMAAGLVAGVPVLTTASCKALVHDQFTRFAAQKAALAAVPAPGSAPEPDGPQDRLAAVPAPGSAPEPDGPQDGVATRASVVAPATPEPSATRQELRAVGQSGRPTIKGVKPRSERSRSSRRGRDERGGPEITPPSAF
jgi:hypothetical protein